MIQKQLSLKYLFLSLLFAFVIFVVHDYKTANIQKSVSSDIQKMNTNYQYLMQDRFHKIDIIYDSFFLNNDFIINLFTSSISNKSKTDSFNTQYAQELIKFKEYSIQSIQFYDQKGNALFSKEINPAVLKVIDSYREFRGFEMINNTLALRVIKPFFDKQMQFLGAIEFVLDLQHMLFEFNHLQNATLKAVFNKMTLEKHLDKTSLKKFELFRNHKNYLLQTSVYNNYKKNDILYDIAFEQRSDTIILQMSRYKSFATTFSYEKNLYTLMFIPINSSLLGENLGYIIAYDSNKYLNLLMEQHQQYLWVLSILFFIIVILLYVIAKSKSEQTKALQLYDDLKTDIDKYVIMTETNKEGIITYVSQAFCNVSGYNKEDLIGRPQNIVRHPDISKTFYKNMWSMLQKGETWEGEIKNIDKNGNSYWIRGIIVPIFDELKRVKGYRSIRVNITDEKQLEKVNSILKDDLSIRFNDIKTKDRSRLDESKIELMSKMLDAFANEWKKPISYISLKTLDLETRLKTSVPSKAYLEKFSEDINELIKRLSSNLNQFKYIFHNKNIKEKYNVFDEVENAVSVVYHEENVEIDLDGEKQLYSFGIASDLNKIVGSLLNNALEQFKLKHISNGKVTIRVSKEDEFIIIRVSDNAMGIPDDIMKKIFEPDFSTKVDFNSKGLSLYISKLMLQKNGGDLSVENIESGCCFTIKLISKDRRELL